MNKDMAESLCEVVGEVQKSTKVVDNEGGYFILGSSSNRCYTTSILGQGNHNGEWRKELGELQI